MTDMWRTKQQIFNKNNFLLKILLGFFLFKYKNKRWCRKNDDNFFFFAIIINVMLFDEWSEWRLEY